MIRRLTEADRAVVIDFLSSAPALNLYMLGNLEKLGFTHEICEFWGDVEPQAGGEILRAVANRYMTGWTVYGWAAALHPADFQPIAAPSGIVIRRGTLVDLPQLVDFYANAQHMSRAAAGVARPLRDTRLWLAEEAGNLLSTALTNAETSRLAMIGGVYTPPAMRKRGLSQAVCSALCADLFAEQKQPILYWSTPAAGAVYRKLGFHAIGQWRSVWLRSC